jgi:SSS family solute:Na+ symporter
MTTIDWVLAIGINVGIVVYALTLTRRTKSSTDFLLAARGLPWWIVGLSAFATAVDSGDYVVVAGGAYSFGMANLTTWWLGLPLGWFLVSYFVFLPMYRSGVYTNAEWLEYRFGPFSRVVSAFIQLQFRTNVLGNVSWSIFLLFTIVGGVSEFWAWVAVVGIAGLAALYSAMGGLISGVFADIPQWAAMALGSFLLWIVVYREVGGWSGLHERLGNLPDPDRPGSDLSWMMHVGATNQPGVPPTLAVYGFIVLLVSYNVVNQTQTMRFLAARSEWDMKMAALAASAVTVVVMFFNITLGIIGRALRPNLEVVDRIYPVLLQSYLPPVLVGLVVAGVIAAGVSTYSSVAVGLSAVFTRDVYARFIKRDGDDAHYLRISRLLVPLIVATGFLYVPFLEAGAFAFYVGLTSVFVIPLAAVFLVGAFSKFHRGSGAVGLTLGALYGVFSFVSRGGLEPIGVGGVDAVPTWMIGTWWTYLWAPLVTLVSMAIYSGIVTRQKGVLQDVDIAGLTYRTRDVLPEDLSKTAMVRLDAIRGTWLEQSSAALERAPKYPFAVPDDGRLPWYKHDAALSSTFIGIMVFLTLVVFW